MFELSFGDYWLMFILSGVIAILGQLWVAINTINAKGEEIYQLRQSELVGLVTEPPKGKKRELTEEEAAKMADNASKK